MTIRMVQYPVSFTTGVVWGWSRLIVSKNSRFDVPGKHVVYMVNNAMAVGATNAK
jgi:hypothetical protein